MREARDSVMQAETPYGRVLQHLTVIDMDDTPQRIPIADPFASLWYFIKEGGPDGFRDFLKHALLEHPPTPDNPWSIIMYTGSFTQSTGRSWSWGLLRYLAKTVGSL